MKNPTQKLVFDSFAAFMTEYVLPRKADHGDDIRLDGKAGPGTKGTQVAAAYFKHQGRIWKVDADTHYKPLQVAYDHLIKTDKDPFVEVSTSKQNRTLVLLESLDNWLKQNYNKRGKFIYIYSPRAKN